MWKQFDLRSCRPKPGQLVALRLEPKNERQTPIYARGEYDIGEFRTDQDGKKLWWHGTHGIQDPVHMKKRYDILWRPVEPFRA